MQADDPISFMQLTAKNEMTSKEDQFQLSLLAAMGNTQRKEAADPLASKLNKVRHALTTRSGNYVGNSTRVLAVNVFFFLLAHWIYVCVESISRSVRLYLKTCVWYFPQRVMVVLMLEPLGVQDLQEVCSAVVEK